MKAFSYAMILLLLFCYPVLAQEQFTEQTSISLTGVYSSSVAWGDVDGDGRDEVAIGLGPYPASGGFLYSWDDGAAGMPLLGPWNVGGGAYNAANGESFPAGGETR